MKLNICDIIEQNDKDCIGIPDWIIKLVSYGNKWSAL